MNRARPHTLPSIASRSLLASPFMAGSVFALALAAHVITAAPASAQNSPGGFSLPQPTPTPTPAPQGPVDERSGVRILPRNIPATQPTAPPTETPTPAPTAAQTPLPAPAATSAPPRSQTPAPTPSASSPQPRATTPASRTPAQSSNSPGLAPSQQPAASEPISGPVDGPGFDTELIPDGDEGPVGPDGWYDVSPSGDTNSAATETPARRGSAVEGASRDAGASGLESVRNSVYIGLALMALISVLLIWLFWRRRKQDQVDIDAAGPSLASGLHKIIKDTAPSQFDQTPDLNGAAARGAAMAATQSSVSGHKSAATPAPTPPPPTPVSPDKAAPTAAAPFAAAVSRQQARDPARVDLNLDIVGGTRSLMMFSVDFRLDIANRADFAVRDIKVFAELVCAQSGLPSTLPSVSGPPIATVARIGPQQGHRVSGAMQLPLNAVKAIRQGSKPLFIPMLHIAVEGTGIDTIYRSFVIGAPSASSQTRVHPLPLDGPPGGLPSLRAQLIKQPAAA